MSAVTAAPKRSAQKRSGLRMPINRIKADVKRISGCGSMSAAGAEVFTNIVENLIVEVTQAAYEKRDKGVMCVTPQNLVDAVKDIRAFDFISNDALVFVVPAKKRRVGNKAVEATELIAEGEPEVVAKKRAERSARVVKDEVASSSEE